MTPIDIRRKNTLNLFREASKLGSFDEFPVLRPDVDPQLHVSRNEVDQPFFLTCQKDCVIALVSGAATVEFASGGVRFFDLEPGDFVYVPGGAAHRLRVREPGIQLRYKAREAGGESVAWYCAKCGHELFHHGWEGAETLPQESYLEACESFNSDSVHRTCSSCAEVHPALDLQPFRWQSIVQALRAGEAP